MKINKNSRIFKDQEWIAEILEDFQSLESVLSKFKSFQDAMYEPCSALWRSLLYCHGSYSMSLWTVQCDNQREESRV